MLYCITVKSIHQHGLDSLTGYGAAPRLEKHASLKIQHLATDLQYCCFPENDLQGMINEELCFHKSREDNCLYDGSVMNN